MIPEKPKQEKLNKNEMILRLNKIHGHGSNKLELTFDVFQLAHLYLNLHFFVLKKNHKEMKFWFNHKDQHICFHQKCCDF